MTSQTSQSGQDPRGGARQMTPFCPQRISGQQTWRRGLCKCSDQAGLCFKTWCCPCVVFGQTARDSEGDSCCLYSFMWLLGFPGCWFGTRLRSNIRKRHSINGSCGSDCACAYFCGICSLLQEAQEVLEHKQTEEQAHKATISNDVRITEVEKDGYY